MWWVPCTLRKRDFIIADVTTKARKTSHKCGIEVPMSAKNAYDIYRKNSNHFWRKEIER